jgi:hypothetical protein
VVGEDHPDGSNVMGEVADYCRSRAGCRVHVVAGPRATPAGTLVPVEAPASAKGSEHPEKGRS